MSKVSLNVGGGTRLNKPAKLHVHAKHNTHLDNVPDMVSCAGTVASLNKHKWDWLVVWGLTVL